MKNLLIIEADTGDGDYATQSTWLTNEELEAGVLPLLQKVGTLLAQRPGYHNWETGDMEKLETPSALYVATGLLTQQEVDSFQNYVPWGGYGTHTIVSIQLHKVASTSNLLTP